MKYQSTAPSCRPKIAMLKWNINTKKKPGNINKEDTRDCNDIEMLHCIIYAVPIELHEQKMLRKKANSNPIEKMPDWEVRLSRKIGACRRELGILYRRLDNQNPDQPRDQQSDELSEDNFIKDF